jgi:ADP-ribosyl-[dinitrogen reductase] hydrolase
LAGSERPDTAGNGSLMRLAPVAIRHWRDPAALRDVAARQSRVTHAAPEAVSACVAYAELLARAIAGQRLDSVLRAEGLQGAGAIGTILAGEWRGKPRDAIRSGGYVAESLEAALWSVARTGSFRQAVLTAANLGGDADTTAAITGQLAGAAYGLSAIPADWLGRLAWRDRLIDTASRLFEQS